MNFPVYDIASLIVGHVVSLPKYPERRHFWHVPNLKLRNTSSVNPFYDQYRFFQFVRKYTVVSLDDALAGRDRLLDKNDIQVCQNVCAFMNHN
jgi:hypothetical protein